MKKLIALVMGMLLVPTMAFGMEAMSDKAQSEVTGQAGVSIAVDDFKMYQNIDGLWYTDEGGVSTTTVDIGGGTQAEVEATTDGASVGIQNLSVMVQVNALTSGGSVSDDLGSEGRSLQGTYEDKAGYNFNNAGDMDSDSDGIDEAQAFAAKPITIDVTSALPVLTAAHQNNDSDAGSVAGVQIGLGTMEITQTAMSLTLDVADADPLDGTSRNAPTVADNMNSFTSYGTVNIGKITMAILDGSVEIAPH